MTRDQLLGRLETENARLRGLLGGHVVSVDAENTRLSEWNKVKAAEVDELREKLAVASTENARLAAEVERLSDHWQRERDARDAATAMVARLVAWIEGEGSIVPTRLVASAKALLPASDNGTIRQLSREEEDRAVQLRLEREVCGRCGAQPGQPCTGACVS